MIYVVEAMTYNSLEDGNDSEEAFTEWFPGKLDALERAGVLLDKGYQVRLSVEQGAKRIYAS